MYDKLFTEGEFNGTLTIKPLHKLITNAEGRALGTISKKEICDLNGKQIARLESVIKAPAVRNKKQKTRIYKSELGAMRFTDGILFYNDEPVGQVARRKRDFAHIVMLSVATLMLLMTVIFVWLIDTPYSDTLVIEVSDEKGSWKTQETIAVFDDRIAPGSSGKYVFILENPHNVRLNYDFKISEFYNGEEVDNFPIEYRLKMNNVLISDGWLKASELRYYEIEMLPESTHSFTLEWRWRFESGNDEVDTYFGQSNGEYSLVFNMTAQTLYEE